MTITKMREVVRRSLRTRRTGRCAVLVVALAAGACGGGEVETGVGPGREGSSGQGRASVITTSTPFPTTQAPAPTTTIAPVPIAPFIAGESPGTADAVRLRAFAHRFDLAEITLKAGETSEVFFDNADAGDLHDLVILSQNPSAVVFRGATVAGIATGIYRVPALTPGVYTFMCDVHPIFMVGTLKVV